MARMRGLAGEGFGFRTADGGKSGGCGRGRGFFCAEGGEVFAAEAGVGVLVGKFRDEALIELDGIVLAVLFAADFGEAVEGGGGEGALLVPFCQERLVAGCGFREVAGGFLFEEGIAEKRPEVGRRRGRVSGAGNPA